MTIQVEVEGKGTVAEFPDGTDPQVIDAAIKRDYFGGAPPTPTAEMPSMASRFVRPALEMGGMMVGGLLGAASPLPGGSVVGAGLGYGIVKRTADYIEGVNQPKTVPEGLIGAAQDVNTGMLMDMGGTVAGKAIGATVGGVGKVGKQVLGRMTGAGPAAAEEAVRGGKAFTDAMRGKVTGEEIVDNAKEALSVIKANRASAYRTKLDEIGKIKGKIDTAPIGDKTIELMERYGIKVNSDGTFNMSRTALGSKGNRDVKEMLDIIKGWGTQPGDKTPVGLDTLKRQLDDFYSESSNARAFVTELRNTVKNLIVREVPEYAEMTKGYSEATNLIKDIESNLMLRKEGMSGRITADATLRRLMSAMRDNFELRKELLGILTEQGGQDLTGQVAGYTMNAILPRGLAGVAPGVAGTAAALNYLNPKFLPLIVASSPRVSGEFLRFMGITSRSLTGLGTAAGKTAAYLTVPPAENLLRRE